MDERDEPGPAASQTEAADDGAADAEDAAARELEAYRREKQDTGRRMAQRARATRDADWQSPNWQAQDHLDPERSSHRRSRSGAAKDAEGQADTGIIDQTVTDDGNTSRE
jgi:hypothetical protein